MNPPNPFGSPQGGAFQAPSGSMKTGLFQSFGQQSGSSQTPSLGFFQPSAFGQPSVMNQPAPIGSNMFGQAPAFGQSSAQPPAFGQTSLGMSSSGFGTSTKSIFGQTGSSNQSSPFGQTGASNQSSPFGQTGSSNQNPAFGQTGSSNQSSPFGQTGASNQNPAFGQTGASNQNPAFGQTGASNQNPAFGQTGAANQNPAFGQTGASNQNPAFGQTGASNQNPAFGQTGSANQNPAFGQTGSSNQSSPFGQTGASNQNPAFGQTGSSNQSSPFGQTGASNQNPAFGQTGSSNQSTPFGQTPAMGQPSTFGQTSGFTQQAPVFGKQPPAFGQQPSGFGSTQVTSSSTQALGQPRPLPFGQPTFGQPSTTAVSTGMFGGAAQTVTQSRGFGSTEFSFKPANEAVFKPIFSASPEPTNPQTSSPFGGPGAQTSANIMSSSTTTTTSSTNFSVLAGAKSGQLGFSFSQPAAAPSISSQSNPLTASDASGPNNTLQFTFSQPAAPSSSGTKDSATEPTTPSSFSFTTKTLQPQPALFGGNTFSQPVFSDTKAKADAGTDDKGSSHAGLADTNVFARLTKAPKRKNEPAVPGSERLTVEEDLPPEADSTKQPAKRPLMRSRGPPGGLFGRALSGVRREAMKETQREEPERENVQIQDEEVTATPPTVQTANKESEEKIEESEPAGAPEPQAEAATPERRAVRSESLESLSGSSPSDCSTIQCRNVPPALNKKEIIEKHFSQFGKVRKVFCRPQKNLAIVHFNDHASAAKAKKKGKVLYNKELFLLWQRKKQSPGQKEQKFPEEKVEAEEESQENTGSKAASSLLKRPPPLRPSLLDNQGVFGRGSPVKKPSLVKSLQFDSEPQRDSGTEPESSERPLPSSLHHLVGLVAETAEDKYRLLEQKDKVLRQGRPKRTDLDMSKVFVGTCPDMCPEKERYMRETRNQLSTYEVLPNTEMVDHATAIKEYSRSSADQEEPLPHDLRPLPVLCMTMDYLVTEVMDQGKENCRDWYDFVWNRTRGIRKDITQQRLCCPMTVSLIEKCTRFHVHCAHHLCEEHMSSFDAKINNENMTKCLQSLKEMYEDLAMRQVFCPREAEFRQYNVLLKLNEGDILREVQQFRDEVRKSPEVKFAVQAFAAVNSNNFVRFFNLVKRASYLASCLLHRYFNQVRAKALKILNIAHTVGPRSTAFPVEDIVRMLMFRDAAEAADFIQQYGLNVNDDMVELSRPSYQGPELPLSQKKSEVILVKKAVLIGEVVNGGPLPNPPHHVPVCSFDSQNRFHGEVPVADPAPSYFRAIADRVEVKEPPTVEMQHQVVPVEPLEPPPAYRPPPAITEETGETAKPYQPPAPPVDPQQLFQPISQPPPVKPPSPPPKPKPVYTDEEILAELDSVVGEVVDAAVREVAEAGASYTAAALMESSVQAESVLEDVLGKMVQEVSSTEIKLEQERVAEEKRKLEEDRRRKEHEAFLIEFGFSLCTKLVDEVVNESVQETASSEIQQAVSEKAACVAKCTEQVCSSLVEETLNADIAVLVEDILEAELQRICKYIKRWRDVVAVRRQLKRQMRGFPAAPCCVDPRFKLKALAPSAPAEPCMADLARGLVNLGNAGVLSLSSTRLLKNRQAAIHQMRVHYFYQQLVEETVWAPLHLPALLTQHIPDPPERIFWKAVLLLPSDHESVASLADRILSDWLEVKFGGERKQQADGIMQTLCVGSSLQEHAQRTHQVHVSVKACRGPLTADGLSKVEEGCELQGAGALVMLLPALAAVEPGQDEQDVPLLSALLQLKQLQQVSAGHQPLPLVILVPGPEGGAAETHNLEEALKLETLVKESLISEFTFFFIPETTSDLQGTKQLSQALSWLLARAPPPSPISCQTLLQLVEGCLMHVFAPRVAAHCQDRVEASLPSQDPAPIIQFYNSLLAQIAQQVSSEELCKLSWPAAEFCTAESVGVVPPLGWNSAEQLAWLQETILSLQLPAWEPLTEAASWPEVRSSISNYVGQMKVSAGSQPLLISHLENLLQRVQLKAWQTQTAKPKAASWRGNKVHGVGGAYRMVPWESVVGIFMDGKLKDWQPPGPPACEDVWTDDGEILVYFLTDMLKDFQPPEEWIQAVNQTHREKQQEKDGASAAAPSAPSSKLLRQRLFHSDVQPQEAASASATPLDITHTPTPPELLAHQLLEGLEEEKAQNNRAMEQLQRWLDGEPVDHLSTPLLIPSSNILCMPLTIRTPPTARTRETPETLGPEPEELPQGATCPTTPPVSISRRLKELQQQILSSQEEERACRLKLSSLMSIVDD